jgi:hypothetical protein
VLAPLLLVVLASSAACGRASSTDLPTMRVVDLARTFDGAEHRPPAGFAVVLHEENGIERPSIVAPVPSRASWSLPLPRHGLFHAFLAMDPGGRPGAVVRFRLGISDGRVYEDLTGWTLTDARGWTELRADLSAFAGVKWSLFYRPDWIRWRLVLATDPAGPVPAHAIWGSPEILTDVDASREYLTRRIRVP